MQFSCLYHEGAEQCQEFNNKSNSKLEIPTSAF